MTYNDQIFTLKKVECLASCFILFFSLRKQIKMLVFYFRAQCHSVYVNVSV